MESSFIIRQRLFHNYQYTCIKINSINPKLCVTHGIVPQPIIFTMSSANLSKIVGLAIMLVEYPMLIGKNNLMTKMISNDSVNSQRIMGSLAIYKETMKSNLIVSMENICVISMIVKFTSIINNVLNKLRYLGA